MVKFENNNSNNNESDKLTKIESDVMRIELNILSYIERREDDGQHPNLIRLIGATTMNENEFFLMTEYCEYGCIDRYLQQTRFVNEIVCNGSVDRQEVIFKVN